MQPVFIFDAVRTPVGRFGGALAHVRADDLAAAPLRASGMDAIATAARTIVCGEAQLTIAGGVEPMSRAPWAMPKADAAFNRRAEIFDTTLGWRFVNPRIEREYGIDSMPQTGENVAEQCQISREDQDAFALRSQQRAAAAQASGHLAQEITPVEVPQRRSDPLEVALGHPLGMTGARRVATAAHSVHCGDATRALATTCVGVGQGVACLLERP